CHAVPGPTSQRPPGLLRTCDISILLQCPLTTLYKSIELESKAASCLRTLNLDNVFTLNQITRWYKQPPANRRRPISATTAYPHSATPPPNATSLSHTQTHMEDAGAGAGADVGGDPSPRPKGVHSKLVKRLPTCALLMTRPIVIRVWRANHR
ncbi:hypothetical protein CORC01_09017, partial [Colletotrichum orchidophilum]